MPDGAPVIFSAHGVPKSVPAEAARRKLLYLDATCPLVSKVHREAERHYRRGPSDPADRPCPSSRGDRHHGPAAAPARSCWSRRWPRPRRSRSTIRASLAYITQTTLSADDTAAIVAALRRRFPHIEGPQQGRYLLRHHQPPEGGEGDRPALRCPARAGRAQFLQFHAAGGSGARRRAAPMPSWCAARRRSTGAGSRASPSLGITAGASAPEILVEEVLAACRGALCRRPWRRSSSPARTSSSSCPGRSRPPA